MSDVNEVEAVAFDILGTLVDEPGGLRRHISDAVATHDDEIIDELLAVWQDHVAQEQQRIADGHRVYVNSEIIDSEAAQRVATHAGLTDPTAITRLATAGQRLPPWGDSVTGLQRLAQYYPVLGLSNAGHAALLRVNAHAGLRWHHVLSAETVQAYKPAPEVYELAISTSGCAPAHVLMVAAHAWDLRGAQQAGMRTAYVHRPVGEQPTGSDAFDWHFSDLDELATTLIKQ